jgi:hypothetical protein
LRCSWFPYGFIGCERLVIPRFVTGLFAALTITGVVVMPISGIWLLIPPAAGMVFRRRKSE